MANEKQFHLGIKAMIKNSKDQLLLIKEDVSNHSLPTDEYWDFPGGRMQKGETIAQTLRREVQEEIGIKKFQTPQFVAAVISNHEIKLKNGEIVGLILMIYKVVISSRAKIQLSDEHLDYEWVLPKKAAKRLAHKYPTEFTEKLL